MVVKNKCECKGKTLSILSDESKFMPDGEFAGISKVEGRINPNIVKQLHMNIIGREEFNFLEPIGSEYGHLHGLHKMHKPNICLRPILSVRRSPTHNRAKLLDPVGTRLYKYSVNDSFDLVDHLCDISIKRKTMCSFDVNSLFTNIPLKTTIDILCDHTSLNSLENITCSFKNS